MPLKSIVGLDHVVILVRDLDHASAAWRRLGFTVAPRGTHSAHLGTANHTIMLGPDYIELIAVVRETPRNAPSRALLEQRGEGLERIALTTIDAAAGIEEIRALGHAGLGPIDFGRPVTLPDGRQTEARFRVFEWPAEEAPAEVRIFACEHLTPQAVWIAELQDHPNTARRIDRVEIVAEEPRQAADHLSRLIASEVWPDGEGAWAVPSGSDRARFIYLTRAAFEARHPDVPLDGLPSRAGAALVLKVDDLTVASKILPLSSTATSDKALCIAPSLANGVLLVLEE